MSIAARVSPKCWIRSLVLVCILLLAGIGAPGQALAATNCGVVTVTNMTTGPAHGALMRVSNTSCGSSGWVCLDPDGQHMSVEEARRVYAFILTHYLTSRSFVVWTADGTYATACSGSYPVVQEVRIGS